MYQSHFHLRERPFSITPDPRFLYFGQRHKEALAHLLYGIEEASGFVLLTGEIGAGKTTVSRYLLEQLPQNAEIALILNPKLSAYELIATLCDELGIQYSREEASLKTLFDALNAYLIEAHNRDKRVILIVDEAQHLSMEVLEQLRLLTNLETRRQKLLQIILLGQPELREHLNHPSLTQLSQRITARYHLEPLSLSETASYVRHRLAVAGCQTMLFDDKSLRVVYRLSGGVPRVINVLCDRALLGAYARSLPNVTKKVVKLAGKEVLPNKKGDKGLSLAINRHKLHQWGLISLMSLALLWLGYQVWNHDETKRAETRIESARGR